MGTMKNSKLEKQDRKRKSRGLVKGDQVADWGAVDGALLVKAVATISLRGGALRLGYTRDGGAYAIGIYGDGDPFTEYVRPDEDVSEYLQGIVRDYGE